MSGNVESILESYDIEYQLGIKIRDCKNILELNECAKEIQERFEEKRQELELSIMQLQIRSSSLLWNSALKFLESLDYKELLELIDCCRELKKLNLNIDNPLENIIKSIINHFQIEYKLLSSNPEKTKNIQLGHTVLRQIKELINSSNTNLLAELEKIGNNLKLLQPDEDGFQFPTRIKDDYKINLQELVIVCKINENYIYNTKVTLKKGKFNDKEVFIKEYTIKKVTSNEKKTEINNEIECLKKISSLKQVHNFTIKYFGKFYGYCFYNKNITLVMKYYTNTLEEYIKIRVKIPVEEFLNLAKCLLQAFYDLERHNIYHGDIKTSNIMMSKKNIPKIVDFGASVIKIEPSRNSETLEQKFHGSREYFAPELYECFLRGETFQRYRRVKSDVFSLGITFLKMLNGNDWTYDRNIGNEKDRVLEGLNKDCKELISGMIEIKPEKRKSFEMLLNYFEATV